VNVAIFPTLIVFIARFVVTCQCAGHPIRRFPMLPLSDFSIELFRHF
jgi:hypothetical protein